MSGNPSNVVPMSGSWPAQPWPPGAVPPGCFSELARLNQCYNEVQMMEMILAKVVCDLATNNAQFQQCLAEGIAKSGSGVPILGVTDGSNAQPGQVGEWVQTTAVAPVVANVSTTTNCNLGVLQPGDWTCFATLQDFAWSQGNLFYLAPQPAGFSTDMFGSALAAAGGSAFGQANTIGGIPCRASLTVPTLVVFAVTTNYPAGAIQAGQEATMIFQARRSR
jgi:hypothetical protein